LQHDQLLRFLLLAIPTLRRMTMILQVAFLSSLALQAVALNAAKHINTVHMFRDVKAIHPASQYSRLFSSVSEMTPKAVAGSNGVQIAIAHLNSAEAAAFVKKIVLLDAKLSAEADKLNFWTGESFTVKDCVCTGIIEKGLSFVVSCNIKGKPATRDVLVPFLSPVTGTIVCSTLCVLAFIFVLSLPVFSHMHLSTSICASAFLLSAPSLTRGTDWSLRSYARFNSSKLEIPSHIGDRLDVN
jgi:hypothetical protein